MLLISTFFIIYFIITHTVHETITNTSTTEMDTCTTFNPDEITYITYNANMATHTIYNAYDTNRCKNWWQQISDI